MTSSSITVIGGGISGLATAWWLKKSGHTVTLFEKDAVPGGTMKTVRTGGWLMETGPNSALETTRLFHTLCDDTGIADERVYANPAGNNRYILRNGELHPLPMSPGKFLRSRLWTVKGKIRLLKEPFVGRGEREESIAEFVERRLGKEMLDYAINPFVAGVFAGAPESLSVRAAFPKLYALEEKYGGLIRGQIAGARERKKRNEVAKDRAKMFSFKNGMQTLPDALAAALGDSVRVSTAVEAISYQPNEREYVLTLRSNGTQDLHRTQAVVMAVPSGAAAEYVRPFDASLAADLQKIYYPPVTEVFVGYRLSQISRPLDGFGFLVPEKERRSILGVIWSSTLFEGRAPEGTAAFTVFVGGSRQPQEALRDDAEILKNVSLELQELMSVEGEPLFSRVTRWEKAIPQYRMGHQEIVEEMSRFEKCHPGLFLSGNYRGGISVGDCILQSDVVSKKVIEFIASQKH